jgi:PQQ-dependent dehydrogenase (methanol/ethanol family)
MLWSVLRLAALVLVLDISASAAPQASVAPDAVRNPMAGDSAAIQRGREVYRDTCEGCHGEGARGDRGPSLISERSSDDREDVGRFSIIRNGIPGTQMPAFSALPADSIWEVIAYLRSLSGTGSDANEAVPGNAADGEKIFWGKGGCSGCHEVNGRGGIVGPDLSAAGQNSAAYLRGKILTPNRNDGRGWFLRPPTTVIVKTRNGKEIRGVPNAEDNYALVMTDVEGHLHRFDKSDLVGETILRQSLMPSGYSRTLSAAELENLIAYLKSLKARDLTKTAATALAGGLTPDRLVNAGREPQNWLTYWGGYDSHHFSSLRQITPANVKLLQAKWALEMPGRSVLESTPLVVDGTMYTAGQPGQVFAIDAQTGLVIWKAVRQQAVVNPYQSNPFNRGVAMLGDRVFFGTLDAHLIALDARTGRTLWDTPVANTLEGYTITEAPLAIPGEVIVGVAGGEFGIRGFIDAYDPQTGKRIWRTYTIPGPGQFGNGTWSGDSWKHGGGPAWLTGSYDPELKLLYWAVGNPGPDLNGEVRGGDNLFTCSVLALDPTTGKRKWFYQFTPGDTHDWDANEDLILADRMQDGKVQKLLITADRNGMFYELNRTDGKVLFAEPFVSETWNSGIGKDGRPIFRPGWNSSSEGRIVAPAVVGGTNWQSPSYDAARQMLYVVAHDGAMGYRSAPQKYIAGRQYMGGSGYRPSPSHEVNEVLAIDTRTGRVIWRYQLLRYNPSAGVLATSAGLVFVCTADGNLVALDSATGKSLWHFQTGGRIASSPISYSVNGTQFIAVSAGQSLYSFALPK